MHAAHFAFRAVLMLAFIATLAAGTARPTAASDELTGIVVNDAEDMYPVDAGAGVVAGPAASGGLLGIVAYDAEDIYSVDAGAGVVAGPGGAEVVNYVEEDATADRG